MSPSSKEQIKCEKSSQINDDDELTEISEKLRITVLKCDEDNNEESTYNINETPKIVELNECISIKEKGPIKQDKPTNRVDPYCRNLSSSGLSENYYDQFLNQEFNNNNFNELFSFNNVTEDFLNNICDNYPGLITLNSNDESSSNEYYENIPIPVLEQSYSAFISTYADAEKALSNEIDKNKKLKQEIWILVNILTEEQLIPKLRDNIVSSKSDETNLNYIYAIIIRLMKEGTSSLKSYFLNDNNILFQVALKNNELLMYFCLKIMQNLDIDPSQYDIVHRLIQNSQIDLSNILQTLINIKYLMLPLMNIFNINAVDSCDRTILMVLLEQIGNNSGNKYVNMKYLNLILSQHPDIQYTSKDGKNIFHHAFNCKCNETIIQEIRSYYDEILINNLMSQTDYYGFIPRDYELILGEFF